MSSGGSSNDPINLEEIARDPVGTITNAIVNVSTGGLVGTEDGNLTRGVAGRAIDETVGEVTGRNLARKQAMMTQDSIRAAKAQQEQERLFRLQRQEANERQLSGAAARSGGRSGSTGTTGINSTEQQMAVDFLGL